MRAILSTLVVALGVAGCSPSTGTGRDAKSAEELDQTAQSNLLLFPVADAESLLGRSVGITADGAWTIANERFPGCEVRTRREVAAFSTKRRVEMKSLTSMAVGYSHLLSFESKFGRAREADIDIVNAEVLRADVRGACGDVIVDSVFVGHGTRRLLATSEMTVGGGVGIGPVTPSGAVERSIKIVDETRWEQNQGYGFTFRRVTKEPTLDVRVSLPSTVRDGERVEISFESNRTAYLVVYYLDAEQHGDVLWPSEEEASPTVVPGKKLTLPSPKERQNGVAIKAKLRKPGSYERESIIVYAFSDKADFERFKPRVGGSEADGTAYAASISERLGALPLNRWSRAIASYVIQPG